MSILLPGVTVAIDAETMLKSGAVVEKIGVIIRGLTHDDGYAGCCGGERRRIDLALLLALAEIASSRSDGTLGTLFLDEVFDTLDADGIGAAIQCLETIADHRCVVVITHSDELLYGLVNADKYIVCDGGIVRL
jgi:DNA repair exonuclease SbcCD ATPase subunit